MNNAGQRKKLFVDKQVQGAIIRRLLVHWLVACLVMSFYLLTLEMLSRGMQGPFVDHLKSMWQRYSPLFVVVVTLFPVFAYDTVRLSHRFAGPMVSLKRNLRRLAEKQPVAPLRFRQGDFWHELTDDLNRIAENMGLKHGPEGGSDHSTGRKGS